MITDLERNLGHDEVGKFVTYIFNGPNMRNFAHFSTYPCILGAYWQRIDKAARAATCIHSIPHTHKKRLLCSMGPCFSADAVIS